jgi:hypothetical protein
MLALKQRVLQRTRSYSIVSLVDWLVAHLDNDFRHRFVQFSNGESRHYRQVTKDGVELKRLAQQIRKRDVIGSPPKVQVRSVNNPSVKRDINLSIGWCSCEAGNFGSICKHQMKASELYPKYTLEWHRRTDQDSRWEAGCIAFGRKQVRRADYADVFTTPVALAGARSRSSTPAPAGASPNASPGVNIMAQPGPIRQLKAAQAAQAPPTPHYRNIIQKEAEDIAGELVRLHLLQRSVDGEATAKGDLDGFFKELKTCNSGAQFREMMRAKKRLMASHGRRYGKIKVNNRAHLRRAIRRSASAKAAKTPLQKAAERAVKKAKRSLSSPAKKKSLIG